ncbi:MAG: YicC family protein [Ruminococcus sp.]|nr:YicC family protein [Ruminococcus sp.]
MINSMTGFGRFEGMINGRSITLEIKSVNHRYLEFSCRLTRGYSFLEEKLKSYISSKISRGKVDMFVSISEPEDTPAEVQINHNLASGYINALRELSETYNLHNNVTTVDVARYPDVLTVNKASEDEEVVWNDVKEALDSAMEGFTALRAAEGERLKADVLSRAETIMDIVGDIEKRSPETVKEYQSRLKEKIEELLQSKEYDEQRVITEVAIFADKIAVDEETVRLRSHFEQLNTYLNDDKPVGRSIDFLIQEMNREANTIGSKVKDAELAQMVVKIKNEIEKIREQIQNIE